MHGKFNYITVKYNGTQHGIYIISEGQWGLEYQPFKYRIHLNTQCLEIQFLNGNLQNGGHFVKTIHQLNVFSFVLKLGLKIEPFSTKQFWAIHIQNVFGTRAPKCCC